MNTFIPLYFGENDMGSDEGIIRSDSIVEVWFDRMNYTVTIRYRAPSDGSTIDHEEQYESFGDANYRYSSILQHIVDDCRNLRDIRSEKVIDEIIKALGKGDKS